jgi:hypothetical protein
MSSDDAFKGLESEFLALARRIFDAGAKAERARVMALVAGEEIQVSPRKEPRARATGYGTVSGPVRDALIALSAESKDGVGARDIADYFARQGSGPDERQVRAALKTLSITGEAVRASRGRYLPRDTAETSAERGENSGDEPEPFDLAAE